MNKILARIGDLLDNIEYEGYTMDDVVKELNDIINMGEDWQEDFPNSYDDIDFDDL